jgi:PmbA protein
LAVAAKINNFIDFGKKAVDIALKKGAQEAEAFLSTNSNISIDIERGQIVKCMKGTDQGLGVRVYCKKAVGFSFCNNLRNNEIEKTAIRALHSAKASRQDKDWLSLPHLRKFTSPKGTFDKRIEEATIDQLMDIAVTMLKSVIEYDRRVLVVNGGVGTSVFSTTVVNSNGIEAQDKGTAIGCSIETIARDGQDVTPACFEFNTDRVYGVDPVSIGVEAARQAISSLKAEKMGSGSFPIVFCQAAFRSILYYTFLNAIKADFVQRKRSVLKDKIGEKVASKLVTVHDDGLLNSGLLTSKFDGEGVPCQKTLVVEKGVLKDFLYDNYSANKVGVESTGNALRFGNAPYSSTPSLEARNFVFPTENKSLEDLMAGIKKGLIVYGVQGAHSSNPESGEFSVVATPAWKIENGSISHAVRGNMLSGNFLEVLQNISGFGNKLRKMGQLVAPLIRVEKIRVIGRR